ncbi:unnamed protein product [Paramecium primaurelia]|uniref:Uncharacterized protein n=2 Tax=Paramecium TaxID=5884 RepID=A0A8S1UGU6_9CILI|nr:unnamed protein product [Paramecium primaurelia]CAD8164060.1 unnamed protein product [Paramecium pentaurelia]
MYSVSQISKSDPTRYGDQFKPTARKMTHRLLSHCDNELTLKKMDFALSGSGKQIPDYNIKSTQIETKQIEPFKIKDFIPQINPTIKGELSRLNKNNFLDFLLIQKAGKLGDQKFFDLLIQQYNFDPFKKTLKMHDNKQQIQYLQKRDEREEQIALQIKQFYKHMQHKRRGTINEQPLDRMIIEKNNYLIQKLPRFRAKKK